MTKNTVKRDRADGCQRVLMTHANLVWKAWTDPKYVMQWWGPKALLRRLQDGFSRGRKISPLHENAGWAGVLECG